MHKSIKEKINILLKSLIVIFGIIIAFILSLNFYVKITTKNQIIEENECQENFDAIIVLGAAIWGDKPSPMLEDRLLKAIDLYKRGIAPKIIVSGDHGNVYYDEVNVMKQFAISKGVPSEDIFMDHAGFSSYDSIYRAKEIFKAKKIIIVTQKYHLYRALYIANKLEIEAYGASADLRKYSFQFKRELREILARDKDLFKCLFKPEPIYLGEEIPVSGNGNITNDLNLSY